MKKILEMEHISKSFGGSVALNDVHFNVLEGEVHALLGENGAGKSTLMNILTGVIPADDGKIVFLGKEYYSPTIKEMEKAGIAFVHQELNVINDLTVSDNIFLRQEITNKFGIIDDKEQVKKTKELFLSLGVNMDPNAMVSDLKTSEKQLLEICKALYRDAKLLILDEPTTALSSDEIEHLFSIIRNLKAKGKSFIFISHKMPEIFQISDRITVLRNGCFVSENRTEDVTPQSVACDMVGSKYQEEDYYEPRKLGEEILKVHNLSGEGFKNVSLTLRKGEILALTGLAGSGASEFMQALFGVLPIEGGYIEINKKKITGNIRRFMKNKVSMLPANRKENSVIPDLTIIENFVTAEHVLSSLSPFIDEKGDEERYQKEKKRLKIKAESSSNAISSLSGGNQQKVFIARWLNTGSDIILLDNPTQGVDVGAKSEIYRLILEFAKEGKAVIINTLEVPEIQKTADRCAVFYEGEIVKILDHKDVEEALVMAYSTGALGR